MEHSIWIRSESDLVEAIGQVLLRVQTEDVNTIYLSNSLYDNTRDVQQISKDQLVETLAKWSLTHTMYYVEVKQIWTRSVLFAFTESQDGSTNITWEIIEKIVDVIDIWKEQRKKRGTVRSGAIARGFSENDVFRGKYTMQ